jgi:putative transposase
VYYRPCGENQENLELMRMLDRQYLQTPFYGVARMTAWLRREGRHVNAKRVRRLLRLMGLEALYPQARKTVTSTGDSTHRRYPYLLRGVKVERADQVWAADITYVPLAAGWAYLVAILDWFSRRVLAWELSASLETDFCLRTLQRALKGGRPEIFNTDQGCQFTSVEFTGALAAAGVAISMDGRGRAFDNIFVERLWRTVKYEHLYLHDYQTLGEVRVGLDRYFDFYNHQRPHQALDYRTPAETYAAEGADTPGEKCSAAMGAALPPAAPIAAALVG